jgi:hypothetical protein
MALSHFIFRGHGADMKEIENNVNETDIKGKEMGKKQCVCGGMHFYRNCFYLN